MKTYIVKVHGPDNTVGRELWDLLNRLASPELHFTLTEEPEPSTSDMWPEVLQSS